MARVPFVLDVLGIVLVAVGAFMFSTVAGFVAAGLGCLGLSFLVERDK